MVQRSTANSADRARLLASGPQGSFLANDMRAAYCGGSSLPGAGQSVALVQFDGYAPQDVAGTLGGAASIRKAADNYLLTYTPVASGPIYTIPINNVLLDR